jgi:hypothetical protein
MEDFFKWIVAGFAGGAGIWLFIKSSLEKYAGAFLEEKGKNLATKQDIGDITKIVESIKHENNLILEEIKGKHQMRLAAIEKRLQVYQKVYVNLSHIINDLLIENLSDYQKKILIPKIVIDFIDNIIDSTIYLSTPIMEIMGNIIWLLQNYTDTDKSEEKRKIHDEIMKISLQVFELIREDVELPPIGKSISIDYQKVVELQATLIHSKEKNKSKPNGG